MNLNQLKHKIKLQSIEIRYILKKRFLRTKESFLHWGHEKMTVMFIPHNEKKIFNFQISKFTFIFFSLMFGLIIGTSVFAAQRNKSLKKTETAVMQEYESKLFQLSEIQKLSLSVNRIFNEIKPEIEQLYNLTTGINENQEIWTADSSSEVISPAAGNKAAVRQISEKLFELQRLRDEITAASNAIITINTFISNQNKVLSETPSNIPNSGYITSLFGWRVSPFGFGRDFHSGIDIAAAVGTPIKATAPGEVETAGWGGGYGNMVRIKHKYGYETIYAHCSRLNVKTGDIIKKGQIIAFVGDTGSVTGSHCHYELRLGGIQIDPLPYMNKP